MMLRATVAAITTAVALPTAHAQALPARGAGDTPPPTVTPTSSASSPMPSAPPASSAPATGPEGAEKKRRLRFRDDKNACAPGALGEADIQATLTAKPTASEPPKRSDK